MKNNNLLSSLKKKNILLGVTGGIAAYKSLEIVSRLKKAGAEVDVIMTEAATKFVQPLSFRSLSHNPVVIDMFSEPKQWDVKHIALAEKADLFLVAPATANIIGKITNGIADDMLSTTIMATTAPKVLAPAMNHNMYMNSVVQRNLNDLNELGYKIIEADSGYLACGVEGKGRLPDPEVIVNYIAEELKEEPKDDLVGKNILVTAGGTQEPLDPVRYLGNYSSGKMGYAIARQAVNRGANVTLISAPTNLKAPAEVKLVSVKTAKEMYEAVMEIQSEQDIIIKAAAVADYRPEIKAKNKLKKDGSDLQIKLKRNPDILAELGELKEDKVLVGFAAESEELVANAKEKLENKNLDLIIANDITAEDAGFGTDTNRVIMISKDEELEIPKTSKDKVAQKLLDKASKLLKIS
ncbi:MAG: phosphopantothenoylcysteine decarboxylase / phosphopantothenate--cysteine ligase [Candidatus Frackibacter sp. T328-2]|nr:MAG: phosphopantothenoylcysteine decarboxylase / phosphopantothenate--cysteine ligase [Candidatus Frackibacter sp. T328-2]